MAAQLLGNLRALSAEGEAAEGAAFVPMALPGVAEVAALRTPFRAAHAQQQALAATISPARCSSWTQRPPAPDTPAATGGTPSALANPPPPAQ